MGYTYSYVIRAKETGGLGAANYGSVTCPADVVSMANLSLTGPTSGIVGRTYTFDASVIPITATLPITYTWVVTNQPISTTITGTNSSAAFSWSTAGNKTILLSAENLNSSFSDLLTIAIRTHYGIYLPLLRK